MWPILVYVVYEQSLYGSRRLAAVQRFPPFPPHCHPTPLPGFALKHIPNDMISLCSLNPDGTLTGASLQGSSSEPRQQSPS